MILSSCLVHGLTVLCTAIAFFSLPFLVHEVSNTIEKLKRFEFPSLDLGIVLVPAAMSAICIFIWATDGLTIHKTELVTVHQCGPAAVTVACK